MPVPSAQGREASMLCPADRAALQLGHSQKKSRRPASRTAAFFVPWQLERGDHSSFRYSPASASVPWPEGTTLASASLPVSSAHVARAVRPHALRPAEFGAISASCSARCCDPQRRVAAGGRDAQAVHARAGARRDQTADDDVLLQADQRVLLALDRRLGEDAGGLLERRRRDEAAGLQRRLGDAEQDRLALRAAPASCRASS